MKQTKTSRLLLERMARIEKMERGKICPMTGRPHFNHQTWQNGKNVVRYVPVGEVAELQNAIDGYGLFCRLAEEYAEEIIRATRLERERNRKQKKKGE